MKKVLKSLIFLSTLGVLVSCAQNGQSSPSELDSSNSSSSVVSSSIFSSSIDVKEAMAPISAKTLAMKGTYVVKCFTEGEEMELSRNHFSSALTENYFYCRNESEAGETDNRVDKEEDGRAKTVSLNPLTNELVNDYYGDEYNGYYPFDSIFMNPFAKSSHCFEMVGDTLTLKDFESFNFTALNNILTSGVGFDDVTTFDALTIQYQNGKPTTIHVECSNRLFEEYGELRTSIYDGEFTTVEDIRVTAIPKVRAEQPGQEKLGAMFSRIRQGNYTISVTESSVIEDPEEWGEDLPQPHVAKSFVTQEGYYNEYVSGFYGQASDGKYMTEDGLVEFVVEDNMVKETKLPYLSRTVDNYFGFAYNYSPYSFDVNEDNSFTLAAEKGFYNQVWTDLLPDYNLVSVGIMDIGSLTFVVDEEKDTLSYSYTCFENSEHYEVVVSNIGSTSLPFHSADVVKYVPFTNWTEYCDSSTWNKDWGEALDLITNNNKNVIPFIDFPYNYQRSCDAEYDFDFETFKMTMKFVNSMEIIWEFDTTHEMVENLHALYDQFATIPNYTYDKYSDSFVYETEDAHFVVQFKLSNGFMSMDGLFNRAIMMTITNLKPMNVTE